jgi:hypothetical protein
MHERITPRRSALDAGLVNPFNEIDSRGTSRRTKCHRTRADEKTARCQKN